MNEILKVELQFISSQCALDVSIIVGKQKNVTLQIFKFYFSKLNNKKKKTAPYGTLLISSLFSPQ